ncbi:hypothetical protein UlMin_039149 [Ulmus minor]
MLSLLLLLLSPLQLLSSDYTLPTEYFINCGSKSNTELDDSRVFVGDFKPLFGKGKDVKDTNPSNNITLYQTAKIFRQQSWYVFEVGQNGTYLVRLHFFSFSSLVNLSDAVFNVSAESPSGSGLGLELLSNFSVRNSSTSPVIEEFLLTVKEKKFRLYFFPSQEPTSFAFVNAIEVFPVPDNFINDTAAQVTSAGRKGNYSRLLSRALHTILRINVGDRNITPATDTLWRTWVTDDDYLINPGDATNMSKTDVKVKYKLEGTSEYVAPDMVYKTAKEFNSSVTWSFRVIKKAMQHLVRLHFCDIVSANLGGSRFNLFIYNNFTRKIFPEVYNDVAVAFYFDYVVHSDGSGYINISIRPSNDSKGFLNGVEIFEIQNKSGLVPLESHSSKKHQRVLVGSGLASVVIVGMLIWAFVAFKRRKDGGRNSQERWGERNAITPIAPCLNLGLKISLSEILRATDNFDESLVIGEGGFGKVYKGTLHFSNGDIKVAVKRSQPGHGQGLTEFHTEIMVLSQIRNRHLVSLIGYCDEMSEMILVYEFMEKGTLRDHLYDADNKYERSTSQSKLPWEKRLEICIGSAKGLLYLHTGLSDRIIHRDVKSTNILLDENYNAKVADFGLSKSGLPDHDNCSMVLKGSFGYMDPEYISTAQFTEKSDVYAFGVVLLEVICARPAIFTSSQSEEVNLADWGMIWITQGQLEKIIDPFLEGDIRPSSLRVVGEIAEKCLKQSREERPTMSDVEWYLKYALKLQQTGEPYDETFTNASLESALPAVQHMPSNFFPIRGADDSHTSSSVLLS